MRREVTIGRGDRRPPGKRRRDTRDALLAAGQIQQEIVPSYDLTRGSLADMRFLELTLGSGYTELASDRWPCETSGLGDVPNVVFRDGGDVVVQFKDGTIAHISLSWGWFSVRVAAKTIAGAYGTCSAFRDIYPASYVVVGDDGRVPVTFWMNTHFGPSARLRRIDAASWEDIEENYNAEVKTELGEMMGWSKPERDGQLLLWQGSPGTGKTWALRALASEWSKWAEFHYITDPDAFFISDPSYMVNVLLADSYSAIDSDSGEVVTESDPLGKWRILILEDTGDLLASNARDSYSAGLSRLLNVVDGMLGQGLRVLALVTTNDQIDDFHPAVTRPGRCASQLSFGPLSAEEASAWLGETVEEGGTLAELYARAGRATADALPDDAESMTASADLAMQREYEAILELASKPLEV